MSTARAEGPPVWVDPAAVPKKLNPYSGPHWVCARCGAGNAAGHTWRRVDLADLEQRAQDLCAEGVERLRAETRVGAERECCRWCLQFRGDSPVRAGV